MRYNLLFIFVSLMYFFPHVMYGQEKKFDYNELVDSIDLYGNKITISRYSFTLSEIELPSSLIKILDMKDFGIIEEDSAYANAPYLSMVFYDDEFIIYPKYSVDYLIPYAYTYYKNRIMFISGGYDRSVGYFNEEQIRKHWFKFTGKKKSFHGESEFLTIIDDSMSYRWCFKIKDNSIIKIYLKLVYSEG